ncbi:MAG TPA: hypothetical protein VFE53_24835 [Mucilaginibacter sp.]|jgi:hypothetical protein|nr:hypothetical protein [Mucilaginibacter sp.]
MKKILTTVLACIFGLTLVNAQIAKGNLFVGSSFGYASYTSIDNTYDYTGGGTRQQNQNNYALDITPTYGVFVTDHLILGGMFELDYNHDKTDIANFEGPVSNSTNTVVSSLFSIGPFLRYYFYNTKPTSTVLYLQAGAALGTGGGSSSGSGSNSTSSYVSSAKLSGYFLYRGAFAVGITHFVEGNLGLDVSLGYDYLHEHYTGDYSTATTIDATGIVHNSSSSAGIKSITNGIVITAGFHYFIK